ncbi:tetratricopeptide repeat protein [Thermosulfuriphilus sp.]
MSSEVSSRPLKVSDLRQLREPLTESLQGLLPARKVEYVPPGGQEEVFFFDLLSKRAAIPLSLDGLSLGTVHLEQIDPGVLGPELQRWAPLLASFIFNRVRELRITLFDLTGRPNISFLRAKLQKIDEELELLIYPFGLSGEDPGFAVTNRLEALLGKDLEDRVQKLSLSLWKQGKRGPIIHARAPGRILINEALELLDLAQAFGFSLLSSPSAREFLSRFGLNGLRPKQITLPRHQSLILFRGQGIPGLKILFDQGGTKIALSPLSAQELARRFKSGPVGIVEISALASKRTPLAQALFAFEHARLLGQEAKVILDDLSFQVGGDIYLSFNDRGAAVWAYQMALRLNPQNVDAANSLATVLAEIDRPRRAVRIFKDALALSPQDPILHHNLGLLYVRLGRPDLAIKHLERAFDVAKDPQVALALARLLIKERRFEEAVKLLKGIKDKAQDLKGFWGILGESLFESGRLEEALGALKEAVRRRPDDARSLSYLGLAFMEIEGDVEIGLSLCKQALELKPDSPVVQRNYQAALELGRLDGSSQESVG